MGRQRMGFGDRKKPRCSGGLGSRHHCNIPLEECPLAGPSVLEDQSQQKDSIQSRKKDMGSLGSVVGGTWN